MTTATLRGKLLIATPTLGDPNFDRTVVLMLEHGSEGALGVVLNRPSSTSLAETLPDWAPLASDPAVVYVGGPVGIGTIIALARLAHGDPVPGTEPVGNELVAVDLSTESEALESRLSGLRVWTGYAGWSAGQLEEEVAQDAWFVVDAAATDAITEEPDGLWRSVLGRQPGTLAWFSNFPEDPAHN